MTRQAPCRVRDQELLAAAILNITTHLSVAQFAETRLDAETVAASTKRLVQHGLLEEYAGGVYMINFDSSKNT
jgi:hypothetical protein